MSPRGKRRRGLFEAAVSWLAERIPEDRLPGKTGELEEYLRIAEPGRQRLSARVYYARRLMTLFCGAVFCLIFMVSAVLALGGAEGTIEENKLKRPGGGEEALQTELSVLLEGQEEALTIRAQIQPEKLTAEEVQELFGMAQERLDLLILGENSSMDEIRENLNLVSTVELPRGSVGVEWVTVPADLVDTSGVLQREAAEEGELLKLRALLEFQSHEAEYELFGTVYPRQYTGREKWIRSSEEAVRRAAAEDPYSREIVLPDRVDGARVSWRQTGDSSADLLVFLCPVVFLCLYFRETKRVGETVRKRRRQLLLDYPQMVFQLTMLLGAGLTIRGAFFKVAGEYRTKEKGGRRWVYEEMDLSCREMENGVPEAAAYENFGRRCGHPVYRKLGMVLSQNLKKGSEGLAELLEQEAMLALGEEAGTKLLIPMILMLMVVLVILMVPAMMSF